MLETTGAPVVKRVTLEEAVLGEAVLKEATLEKVMSVAVLEAVIEGVTLAVAILGEAVLDGVFSLSKPGLRFWLLKPSVLL